MQNLLRQTSKWLETLLSALLTGLLWCLGFSLLVSPQVVAAATSGGQQKVVVYDDAIGQYDLTPFLEYFVELPAKASFPEVAGGSFDQRFQPLGTGNQAAEPGLKVWLRLRLKNPDSVPHKLHLMPFSTEIKSLEVLKMTASGQEDLGEFGKVVAPAIRGTLDYRNPVGFVLGANEEVALLLRVEFARVVSLQFSLMNDLNLSYFSIKNWGALFLYCGFVGALILYNLFLFARLRDIIYLAYVCFAGSMVLSILTMSGVPDMAHEGPGITLWLEYSPALLALNCMTALFFTRTFLHLKLNLPQYGRIFNIVIGGAAVFAIAVVISGESKVSAVINHVLNIVTVGLAVQCGQLAFRRGFAPARYFLIGWGVFALAIMIWTAGQWGYLPVNIWVANTPLIGNSFEMLFMSLALAERIKVWRLEKITAQREAERGEVNRRLIRVLCHDIANPLSLVSGGIEQAQDLNDPEKMQYWLRRAERGAAIVEAIIENVRKFEVNQEQKLELSAVSVREVFDDVVFIFQDRLAAKNITIDRRIIPEDLRVLAEKVSLHNEVLNNLISNAIKFSHVGSRIDLHAEPDGKNHVLIIVRDRGIGMNSQQISELFEPGVSTSRQGTANESGTGFGVMLMKSFVDAYEGELFVESVEASAAAEGSQQQSGTVFTVKLQRVEAAAASKSA